MCLLGNPFGELPRHAAAAHAQLHSACCQPDDILLWKDTLKSWHETIGILLDFQLIASAVSSVELQWCSETVRGCDWGQWERGERRQEVCRPRWKRRELRVWASPEAVPRWRKRQWWNTPCVLSLRQHFSTALWWPPGSWCAGNRLLPAFK